MVELMGEWGMEHWKVSVGLNQDKLLWGVEVWALSEDLRQEKLFLVWIIGRCRWK